MINKYYEDLEGLDTDSVIKVMRAQIIRKQNWIKSLKLRIQGLLVKDYEDITMLRLGDEVSVRRHGGGDTWEDGILVDYDIVGRKVKPIVLIEGKKRICHGILEKK